MTTTASKPKRAKHTRPVDRSPATGNDEPMTVPGVMESRPVAMVYRCPRCGQEHRTPTDLLGAVLVPPCGRARVRVVLSILDEVRVRV